MTWVDEHVAERLQALAGLLARAQVGRRHQLHQRYAGPVVVHQRGTARLVVAALAGVLLHVDAHQRGPLADAADLELERPTEADGQLVLADLVALRKVRVEVVLPRPLAQRLDLAAQRQPGRAWSAPPPGDSAPAARQGGRGTPGTCGRSAGLRRPSSSRRRSWSCVRSWACTSMPMTGWKSLTGMALALLSAYSAGARSVRPSSRSRARPTAAGAPRRRAAPGAARRWGARRG